MTLTASLIAALGLPVPCDPEHLPETGTPQLLLSCLNSEWAGGGSQDSSPHTDLEKSRTPARPLGGGDHEDFKNPNYMP